jgi:peptidyl-prolyl cis-trans isomerase D
MALAQGSTEGPAAYDAFRSAAFALGESGLPEIVELEDGGLAVLSLDGITPPTLLPFEEVRDDVQAAWQAGAILEQVQARAEAAAQAHRRGAVLRGPGASRPNLEERT